MTQFLPSAVPSDLLRNGGKVTVTIFPFRLKWVPVYAIISMRFYELSIIYTDKRQD